MIQSRERIPGMRPSYSYSDPGERRVLFVDDDASLLFLYKELLEEIYPVHLAVGGKQALKKIARGNRYAVVISDLKMPGLGGIDLLSEVRKEQPDAVRIILTGYADLDAAMKAVNQGHVFRFLTKPCGVEELQAAVQAGMEQYELIQARRENFALKRMKTVLEGIITGLANMVEIKDSYTGGHQRRVTKLACRIAEEMRLDQDRMYGLWMASMVHDVGKIYVPIEFLNKSGKLSDFEFQAIKQHPYHGHILLQTVDCEWPISTIVNQHHERLDGSGYPAGISGEDMLFESKILAVADVVDAMYSYRPYRPSLGLQAALEELECYKGTLYDPRIVECCQILFRRKGFELF